MGGLRHESASHSGLAMLLSNSLTRGTTTKDARQIAMEMDSLACSVAGFAGRNTFGVYGEFLSRNFSEGFALMSACLRRPVFHQDEIDREKQLLLDEIRASRDNLDYQAFKLFQERILGEYDRMVDEYGLHVIDATLPIGQQQEQVREAVRPHLEGVLKEPEGARRKIFLHPSGGAA